MCVIRRDAHPTTPTGPRVAPSRSTWLGGPQPAAGRESSSHSWVYAEIVACFTRMSASRFSVTPRGAGRGAVGARSHGVRLDGCRLHLVASDRIGCAIRGRDGVAGDGTVEAICWRSTRGRSRESLADAWWRRPWPARRHSRDEAQRPTAEAGWCSREARSTATARGCS